MNILVTGAAGFIGFHVSKRLIELGHNVIGVDNLNDYYDPDLKLARLKELGILELNKGAFFESKNENNNFIFLKADIENDDLWSFLRRDFKIDSIIHLAAQAGVRYSLDNPKAYIKSNIEGFLNVLEFCRYQNIKHLIYASSSSVYGIDSNQPFNEVENCNKPISLYAASKRSNELMAFTYSHLYGINSAGLRFFTVYGPWGRPDMAPFLFTKAAFEGKAIKVYNYGKQKRDFTYIDDIVNGIIRINDNLIDIEGAEIFNIGQGKPMNLLDFLDEVEKSTGKQLAKEFVEAQPGDVTTTYADTTKLKAKFNYSAEVSLEHGIEEFVKWFRAYFSY